jgi:hypothetical protein
MSNATFGFHTLKGIGSRLVRGKTDSGIDDWHNYMVKEGESGWKNGLSFERAYCYQKADITSKGKGHHLYRMIVTRQQNLDVLCVVYGRNNLTVWAKAYEALFEKGIMPAEAYKDFLDNQHLRRWSPGR